jgi:type III restriction enzyme
MNITLKDFQLDAMNKLLEFAEKGKKEIILKSPTGSGKTIILTSFINEFVASNYGKFAFVWLSIGKGDLAEQSKEKMSKNFPLFTTNILNDILTGGFVENSATFINWEKITKKGNIAISDSERDNLQDKIEKALLGGIKFILIIDEQHLNDTFKAKEIKDLFTPICEIYASATPKNTKGKQVYEISESEVIASGLIKKRIVINDGLKDGFVINVQNVNTFDILLDLALEKRQEMADEYKKLGVSVNPLICVQIPNNSKDDINSALVVGLEKYFTTKNISVENGLLSFWLSERKDNKDGIENNNAVPIAMIFKQAIATGWDCPRACILVKLRENMDETFEIQTIGRIRRMPEAKHYENDLLDWCYVYTFDKEFIAGLSKDIYGGELRKLLIKPQYKKVMLKKEYNPDITTPIDNQNVREYIANYFALKYKTKAKDYKNNKLVLETNEYIFDTNIVNDTIKGSSATFGGIKEIGKISGSAILSTHIHGRLFHHCVGEIGSAISMKYEDIINVIRALFVDLTKIIKFKGNIFGFNSKMLYAFVINNVDKLKKDFNEAMLNTRMPTIIQAKVNVAEWFIPQGYEMPIDENIKRFVEYSKNVYSRYLSCAGKRSDPEKIFEKWCEGNKNIVWFYKNGEHNKEFFSLVYAINSGKQKHFYPDYILQDTLDNIWIIETKGGQTSNGISQNIDHTSEYKFNALIKYIDDYKQTTFDGKTYKLRGGFVRFDCGSQTLLINTTKWSESLDNITVWQEIEKVVK